MQATNIREATTLTARFAWLLTYIAHSFTAISLLQHHSMTALGDTPLIG